MSEAEQENAAAETGIPAVPGHQGGPPPTEPPDDAGERAADEAGAGHPDHIEPHAGVDK